jgi:choline dehydrogenase-like flavoprotein
MHHEYDVIIIGTGAGGGTLAQALAPTGKRILILERGDYIPRERENWDPVAVFDQKRYLANDHFRDAQGQQFQPYTHACVGGNTKMYGAALLRLREHDFGEVRHAEGVSPAWPVTYREMEPYYTRAEQLYTVHGQRGLDPCEPACSAPFPHPPLSHEPRVAALVEDLRAQGLRPFPMPIGIRPARTGESPSRLSAFDGYPDPTQTKADAHVVGIASALQHPNVTLLTRCTATRLVTDASGRSVREVIATQDGQTLRLRGGVVVLACGAIHSAALLLRSASDAHPAGLANSSDQVGRNYMTHQNGLLIAVMSEPNSSQFQKTFALTDWYRAGPDEPFPMGIVQLMGKPDMGTLAWCRGDALPGEELGAIAARTIDFFLTAEDLPDADNRITLSRDGAICVSYERNNTRAYERLRRHAEEAMSKAEARHGRPSPTFLHQRLGVSGTSHQNGTLRFGNDPRTSVLDANCKAHDLDNLYAVDGSIFPSSGAVNPSLTIMANALRVGDHLIERLGASGAQASATPPTRRSPAMPRGAATPV